MSFFHFFRVAFSTLKISKIIWRKDLAMKRHPVHDSFSVQTQLALIACSHSAWWLQLPPLEESLRRGFHNAGSHQPTSLRQPSPTQLSDRWTTGKPLFWGGLVLMQLPCWGCDLRSDQAPVDEGRGEDVRRTNTWPAANAWELVDLSWRAGLGWAS